MADTLQQLADRLPHSAEPRGWNPPDKGHLDMRISRDGRWHYQGSPVTRPALIKLFASILRLEAGRYYLVTPVEKLSIEVDELPFVSQQLEILAPGPHQQVQLISNIDEHLFLSQEHPLCFHTARNGEQLPCVEIRDGLRMLLQRSHFYQMVEHALAQASGDTEAPGILSSGALFALQPDYALHSS